MSNTTTFEELTIMGTAVVISVLSLVAGIAVGKDRSDDKWKKELLEKGYAEFDKKTGEWHLCEPEVVLFNHDEQAQKTLHGGTVTIKDYIAYVETDLKRVQDKVEEQAKELIEQDLLIEKYKKNIKIPGESSDKSKKNVKSPPGRIDVSKLF